MRRGQGRLGDFQLQPLHDSAAGDLTSTFIPRRGTKLKHHDRAEVMMEKKSYTLAELAQFNSIARQ